jgi:GNAT superfamily N-acetyltransferase
MIIVDAAWEKRNLGIVVKEVNLDGTETIADLEKIRELDYEYAVVRVPAGAIELMFTIEDLGFHYIESMLSIHHDLKNVGANMDRISKRIADSVTYSEMDEEELTELWEQLRLGIFDTDRIYVDPQFTPEQSANRYVGWFGDELNRGGRIFKCVLNGKTFGYFVSKIDSENVNHVINIGTYKEFQKAGLGVALVNATLRQAAEAGARMSVSGISSNNMSSIKANLAAGYSIVSAQYIYIKHN